MLTTSIPVASLLMLAVLIVVTCIMALSCCTALAWSLSPRVRAACRLDWLLLLIAIMSACMKVQQQNGRASATAAREAEQRARTN
jgi:hypothetical protein